MAQKLELVQKFQQPRTRVWEAISDHRGLDQWLIPGAKITLEPEGQDDPNGVGAVRVIRAAGVDVAERIVEFVPQERFSYTLLRGAPITNHLGEVRLEDHPKGTTVRWSIRFDATLPGTGAILSAGIRVFIGMGLRRLARQLS